MRVGKEKGKGHPAKVLEKKLITPPEILCKKLPRQFAFFFQYLRKLKFEERPDYNMIKSLFCELFLSKFDLAKNEMFSFDWFKDVNDKDDIISRKDDKAKSSLNEINENDELNNLDKMNDSSKIIQENDEVSNEDKKNDEIKDNLNINNIKEDEKNKNDENSMNNNKIEEKKEKSSSGSYGLIKSDLNNK